MIKQGNSSFLSFRYNFQLNPNRHNSSQEGIAWNGVQCRKFMLILYSILAFCQILGGNQKS